MLCLYNPIGAPLNTNAKLFEFESLVLNDIAVKVVSQHPIWGYTR